MNEALRPAPSASAPQDRSRELLTHLRTVFAEKGFDGASMQDLARAAGISAGNFYRYFPSKAAIVEAMVLADMAEIEADFTEVRNAPDPLAALRDKLRCRIEPGECQKDGQLWAEITAAALRKPEIAQVVQQMETAIIRFILSVFAQATGLSADQAAARFAPQAELIVMLVKASATHPVPVIAAKNDLDALILRILDAMLTDVAQTKQKD